MSVSPESPTRPLIIDDDVKACRLFGDYLRRLGYDVSAAHNGPEGQRRALEEPFADQPGHTKTKAAEIDSLPIQPDDSRPALRFQT